MTTKAQKSTMKLLWFALMLFAYGMNAQTIRYVKPTASGTGNGTSWANASSNLQAMIDATGVQQVWVAAGTYISGHNNFRMKNNVAIYGGFAGTENQLAQRNWLTNATILSGNNVRCAIYNSFYADSPLNSTALLDGFTITGGATAYGGGIYNEYASPTLSNLTITGNTAHQVGGGLYNYMNSSPNITNVTISGNTAQSGGGMYNTHNSSPILTNVTIAGNTANLGGGIYNVASNPVIRNTIVYNNSNGVENNTSTPTISNSLVQGYTDTANGNISGNINPIFVAPLTPGINNGGNYRLQPGSPAINAGNNSHIPSGINTDLDNSPRISNTAVDLGAYEYYDTSIRFVKPTASGLADGSSWANASANLQVMVNATGVQQVWVAAGTYLSTGNGFVMKNNVAIYGGFAGTETALAQRNWNTNVTTLSGNNERRVFYNSFGTGNPLTNSAVLDGFTITAASADNGAGMYNYVAHPTLRNLIFSGNTATGGGGAIYNGYSSPLLTNVIIKGNSGSSGGGIFNNSNSNPVLTNVLISGNSATTGGGIRNGVDSSSTLINVTLAGNRNFAIQNTDSTAGMTLQNTIVYGNQNGIGGNYTMTNSLVQGLTDTANGNLSGSVNPMFVSAMAFGLNTGGDYRLSPCSPVINRGSSSYVTNVATDLAGNPRNYGTTPDMGAYEYQATPGVALPTAASPQAFCGNATVVNLAAGGSNIKWYSQATGGAVLATTTALATGTYYATQTTDGCESARTAINVTINPLPAAPTAPSIQTLNTPATVATLSATGQNIQWYNTSSGGTPLANNTTLTAGVYYATQTVNGCESASTAVQVTLINTRYVKSRATGAGDGTSWANASSNLQAMVNATGVQQVWVAAGTHYTTGSGLVMKNNVAIYGGFAGTENQLAQRNWVTNVTTLSGNNQHGVVYNSFISSSPLNNTAVLNGFTLSNGNISSGGGGILNNYASPTLTNVTISGNTAQLGGGMLNVGYSSPVLTNVTISGNTAREGGGINNQSSSSPIFSNVTISGNTATHGGGMINFTSNIIIRNTIVYNNSDGLYNASPLAAIAISHSLVQGLTSTENGNISGNTDPMFVAPLAPGVSTGGDYRLTACSPLINMGNNSYVTDITTDLNGNQRIYGSAVDIGAYEYQATPVTSPTATAQVFCGSAIVANLTANGTEIKWYSHSTGGNVLATTATLATGTYYASQTVDNCESTRTAVSITINPIPEAPTAEAQTFCNGFRTVDLSANGNNLKWYFSATGGSPLGPYAVFTGNAEPWNFILFVSQTVNGCESTRRAVNITVNPIPAAPVASAQTLSEPASVDNLSATGQGIQWYNSLSGGAPLDNNAALTTGTYYATQTVNGCESARIAVTVTIIYPIHYVKTTATGTGDGTSWANASSDLQAMVNATGVEQVWVAAGTHYTAGNGLVMKNNVAIYGGFNGTETLLAQRNWNTNVTVLSGNNDRRVINNDFSVETPLNNTALIDGFTITSGKNYSRGPGINNNYSSPMLKNLIITHNESGPGSGAGIFNDNYSSPMISNVKIIGNDSGGYGGGMCNYNNSSPTLVNVTISGNSGWYGGAIYNSSSSPILINVTISGNRSNNSAGIHNSNAAPVIRNSIIYTNYSIVSNNYYGIYNDNSIPTYYNSLVQGVNSTENGNISGDINPMFVAPLAPGLSAGGDYRLQASSSAINAGNNDYFAGLGSATLDLAGNSRVYGYATGGIIDMGAYEYQGSVDCTITTTWNGSSWNNDTPTSNRYTAVINGNYTSTGNITACSLTVNGGNVVVNSGHTFTIKGTVTVNNNATLTFNNNAALVQTDNVQNNGNIIYKKNSNPLYRLDYTLWSSPVANQNLLAFSPQTNTSRFYEYGYGFDPALNRSLEQYWIVNPETTSFDIAKGYLVRMPNGNTAVPGYNAGTAAYSYEGIFTGVAHNGNVARAASLEADRYTAVGNPYPSPISVADFYNQNSGVIENNSAIYFWRKRNNSLVSSYASLTLAAYTANIAGGGNIDLSSYFTGSNANWLIAPAQGFIVRTKQNPTATNITFSNSMRRPATANIGFFRTAQTTTSRFWLNIANEQDGFSQAAIVYMDDATLDLDYGYDGLQLNDGSSVSLYSLAAQTNLSIQARPPFEVSDVVPIGFTATTAGTFTIALDRVEGLFEQGQDIYIKDNLLGTVNNLDTSYTFTSEAGAFNERFEVVYTTQTLSNGQPQFTANNVIIYKDKNAIAINSGNEIMKSVAIYDTRGRLLYRKDAINAVKTAISNLQVQEQMLIVQITTANGTMVSKKILF
ncbi:T9SS sorting signal type C domain-containing protein [Flavobacterium sp. Sd200]|uniref:choice-of-anchor Q domain-containing protein n=1 Tax=Flavobacterium sp. Sd200 TaxID=2692211 RepID=UPI00136A1C40|nr:choice-of-anchor Q domain-containing protein [Flavobacterium sp. Sd200]MXN90753.1 T9SS sorting signal type C domain-containing protein [Flavobacterium sp. Sd200]